jgi:anaerobic selenocysteine-containing dehydrogenase
MSASITEKPSVCPLDCPDTCSLSVQLNGDQIIGVKGSSANPYTAGAICNKVANFYPDVVHGEKRVRKPLIRVGERGSGQYKAVSWEAAIDAAYDGMQAAIDQFGPESVMPFNYAGPHGLLSGGSMDYRFFHRLGATQLIRGPLCGAVRGTAYSSLFGNAPGMAPAQAEHADLIAVWGNNVTVSNMHLARVIKTARENQNASLIVVDPKRTRIAEMADLYLQIQPGTDVVLAYALARALQERGALDQSFIDQWVHGAEKFIAHANQQSINDACQQCGVSSESFEKLVQMYAQATNLALSIGNGIERGKSGGSGLRAIMSINALLGQLGRPGAGVIAKHGASFPFDGAALQRPDLSPQGTRAINIVDAGKMLLDKNLEPPIKAVMIYNHNPVATHPDQNRMRRALSQEDLFIIGSDVVMTDSMQFADVILPAASHFEHDDIYGAYGQNYLQRAEPAIDPVGQSLPNTEIFRRLAARFGFDDSAFLDSDKQLMDDAVRTGDRRLQGFNGSQLPLDRALVMTAPNDEPNLMCNTVKPDTPSGKVELYSESMQSAHGFGLPRYEPVATSQPFNLISPSSNDRTNATFGGHAASQKTELIEINPADAQQLGVSDGQSVRVFNERGETQLIACVTDAVAAGVVYSAKGTWLGTSNTGQTVNALIDADLRTDIADGACYNDTWVGIELMKQ